MTIEAKLDQLIAEQKETNKLLRALIQGLAEADQHSQVPFVHVHPDPGAIPQPYDAPIDRPGRGPRFSDGRILYGAPPPVRRASHDKILNDFLKAQQQKEGFDSEGFRTSPIYCAHANECPNVCPCPHDCYCKAPGNMCFTTSIVLGRKEGKNE